MKKLVNLLLTLSVLAGLSYVLWSGFQKHEASPEEAEEEAHATAAAPDAEAKAEDYTVVLEKEQVTNLGLTTDHPLKIEHQAQRAAYGTVLDPTALITLDSEIAAATAALTASGAAHQRTLTLVATNDASKQAAETTLAQSTADQIKLDALLRSARLQWANRFIGEPKARRLYTDQLVMGNSVLIRLDTLPGDGFTELPRHATLTFPGHESTPIPCDDLEPATTTDPKTQSAGFILRLDQPPFPLRPGQNLTAWLDLPAPPRPGVSIHRSAILRHDGRTWIYLQEEEEKYVRKPIILDSQLDGGNAWFITTDNGITTEDLIVTTGAATLLSEELKAKGASPEID